MPERPFADTSILIVEDDAASARMIATLLASEGASLVRAAHSAEEALAILGTVPIRVLIVDVDKLVDIVIANSGHQRSAAVHPPR